jgi:hypothetical protein
MSLRLLKTAPMPTAVIGAACLLTSIATGQTATLTPIRDNTIYESLSGQQNSNALGVYLFTGLTAANERRRALVQFSLASVPAGATVTSAALTVYVDRGSASTQPITLHRVTSSWGQGTSSASLPGGQGTAATPDDPTWNFSHFNTIEWHSYGGDFVPESSSQVVVGAAEASYTFDSNATIVADVQAWLADPSQNFGWIIVGDETVRGSALRLGSREGTFNAPVLTVTYSTTPVCGTSDFNGDGDFGTDADIEAFFACLAGNCCPTCFAGGTDFNMDGDTGTDADIEAFFRVLAGNAC